MPQPVSKSDLRRYALLGAQARLEALADERESILRSFPELQHGTPAPSASGSSRSRAGATAKGRGRKTAGRRGRRRPMSAAERRAVSERMSRYWAERRKRKAKTSGKAARGKKAR